MFMNDWVFKRRGPLSWRVIDGLAVALDESEGKVFHFDSVGTAIWSLLDGETSVNETIRALAEKFDAPESKIRKDALKFIKELDRQDLIERVAHAGR